MRKRILTAIIVIAAILLFPIRMVLKDGGSVEYRAILYTVTDVHRVTADMDEEGSENRYYDGMIINILGFEVFNNVRLTPDTVP